MKRRKIRFPIPLDPVPYSRSKIESMLRGKCLEVWTDGKGWFFQYSDIHGIDLVPDKWREGCALCGAYKEIIQELELERSALAACKFSVAHMEHIRGRGYLCKGCIGRG